MWEIIKSGGWLMLPIILSSIAAMAIIGERFWALQPRKIIPKNLVAQIWQWIKSNQLSPAQVDTLRKNSPLGRILASGLLYQQYDRELMKQSIEETGRHVVHELERYLNTLGTIAAISPMLGLLGTIFGMIQIFDAIAKAGVGNPAMLSAGISQALITTAAGLIVAIPALMFHRYFNGKINELVITMEQEALKMVELLHHKRG